MLKLRIVQESVLRKLFVHAHYDVYGWGHPFNDFRGTKTGFE
jgi:hypothetical protein